MLRFSSKAIPKVASPMKVINASICLGGANDPSARRLSGSSARVVWPGNALIVRAGGGRTPVVSMLTPYLILRKRRSTVSVGYARGQVR